MKYIVRIVVIFTLTYILIAVNSFALQELPRSGIVEFGIPTGKIPASTGVERFTSNVNVTQNVEPQNETTIAFDPNNPVNLVAGTNDYRYGDTDAGFAYSFDGGATWQSDTLNGVNPALGKYDAQGDPAIAAYGDGIFYFAFIDFNREDNQNRLAVAKSMDGGITWPQLGVIIDHLGPGSHDFEDKEYIAVDNTGGPFDGNVYISWTRFPVASSSRIMFSCSTDGGQTFSTPIQISDTTGSQQGSVPVIGPNGEVYVVWQKLSSIVIDKSTDGGVTWGNDIEVAKISPIPSPLPGAQFRVNSFPTIAIDRTDGSYNGNIYVAWADRTGVGRGPDILFTRSTNGGLKWKRPIRISRDRNSAYQWFPWMSVGTEGNIDVVFYDRRETPNSPFFHTYYAQSKNGGRFFGRNIQVTDQVSDSRNDGFSGEFIGDYNGICSTTDNAHPFWTDIRNANQNAEGYTAAIASGQLLRTGLAAPPIVDRAPLSGKVMQPALLQNYPNPFNPETWIPFELAQNASVTINIYDNKGQLIRTIALGPKKAGVYLSKSKSAYWDGRDSSGEKVASGVYFYTLQVREAVPRIGAGEFSATRKMIIVK